MSDYTEAQQAILGSILIDSRCMGEVISAIKPDDFLHKRDCDIFLASRDLFLDNKTVDPVTILEEMRRRGTYDERTSRQYILQLMDITPTAANVAEYIKIARDESRRVRLVDLGRQMAEVRHLDDARAIAEQMQGLLVERRGVRAVSMQDALLSFYERQKTPRLFLPWCFQSLEDGLYAEPGDLIILGGRPSDGKTALALQMAFHQAMTKRVAFFSLETKEDKLFDRIFSSVSKVPGSRIKRRALTEEDYEAMSNKTQELLSHNLHLIRASEMTAEDIRAYTRAGQFDIVYIDYLQLVPAEGKDDVAQVTNVSKALHRMAASDEVAVIALAQLNREGERGRGWKDEKRSLPRLLDLRGSGQIEQDADIVMFISRENQDQSDGPRVLSVAKNKEGPLGEWDLDFDANTQSFAEIVSNQGGQQATAAQFAAVGRAVKSANRARGLEEAKAKTDSQDYGNYEMPF